MRGFTTRHLMALHAMASAFSEEGGIPFIGWPGPWRAWIIEYGWLDLLGRSNVLMRAAQHAIQKKKV
jgi:hypothetical protein